MSQVEVDLAAEFARHRIAEGDTTTFVDVATRLKDRVRSLLGPRQDKIAELRREVAELEEEIAQLSEDAANLSSRLCAEYAGAVWTMPYPRKRRKRVFADLPETEEE